MRFQIPTVLCSAAIAVTGCAAWAGCGGSDDTINGTPHGGLDGSIEGAANGVDSGANADGSGANVDGAVTDASNSDAGDAGGLQLSLPCGPSKCPLPSEVCCVFGGPNGAGAVFSCADGDCSALFDGGFDAGAQNPKGGLDLAQLKCEGQANCAAGSICCAQLISSAGKNDIVTSACVVGKTCGDAGPSAQLCDPAAAVTGCPASGALSTCSSNNIASWELPPPFATCGGVTN